MSTSELIAVSTAEHVLVCPLFILSAIYGNGLTTRFTVTEIDVTTHEARLLCCYEPSPSIHPDVPSMPIIFEVMGHISPTDCFLTGLGDGGVTGLHNDAFVSFWVTPPTRDYISRLYWVNIREAIEAIAQSVHAGPLETDQIISGSFDESDNTNSTRLQIVWQPVVGQTIASSLPFYNERGQREVPTSISDIPFGRTMRIAFSLEYYLKYDPPRRRILFAILESIVYI